MLRPSIRLAFASGMALLSTSAFFIAGCSDSTLVKPNVYREPTSEANVLYNLQKAYTTKDPEGYADILADDFRFYPVPETRTQKGLPQFWDRTDDCTWTSNSILASPKVNDVRITLTYGTAVPLTAAGQERWTIVTAYANLDVDQRPDVTYPEGITYQIQNQRSLFYFRKGRTPADTLASSATSQKYFLVEWLDQGGPVPHKPGSVAIERTTWSDIKALAWNPQTYWSQSSEDNVLHDLKVAYVTKDAAGYAKLLADDFHFYFDPDTRVRKNLPEFWGRSQDSTGTALSLLSSSRIETITLALSYSPTPLPVTEPRRERWTRIFAYAAGQVEVKPDDVNPNGLTYMFSDRRQQFYFRKGRSPADTLDASPTARRFFLVEWWEEPAMYAPGTSRSPAVMTETWSSLKTLYSF